MTNNPSQKILVEKYLDWCLVKERLDRFSALSNHFPIDFLREFSNRPPFYCHYISWRLGTYPNGTEFFWERINQLFEVGSGLEGWKSEFRSLRNSSFHREFWSLIWQLQVAEHFQRKGTTVKWNAQGPDLSITSNGLQKFYVECYTYQKSFGTKIFIEELASQVDSSIQVKHVRYAPLSLPQDKCLEIFLSELFTPLLNNEYIAKSKKAAESSWPVLLPVPGEVENFQWYWEGEDIDLYSPEIVDLSTGDPDEYLRVSIKEAVNSKNCSNQMNKNQPNALFVNLVLSPDYQVAKRRQLDLKTSFPSTETGSAINGLRVAVCGIDEQLDFDQSNFYSTQENHPYLLWLKNL